MDISDIPTATVTFDARVVLNDGLELNGEVSSVSRRLEQKH